MAATADLMALDRIVSLEPGVGATALRNVPNTLAVFETHFPRKPVVPGVLIMGSLERLAQKLLAEQTGTDDWALGAAKRVRFRTFVEPGDVMELQLDVKDVGDDEATFKATVSVDGQPVTTFASFIMRRRDH